MPARPLWPIDVIGGIANDIRLHSVRYIRVEFALGLALFGAAAIFEISLFGINFTHVSAAVGFGGVALNCLAVLLASGRAARRVGEPPPATTNALARVTLSLGALIIVPLALTIAVIAQWRFHPERGDPATGA